MASNNLPQQVRTSLDARMDSLFGRVLTGFPCPLGYHSRLELGWCNLEPEQVERVRAVLDLGVLMPVTSMHIFVGTTHLRMFGRDAPDADPVLAGMVNKPMNSDRAFIASRLGYVIAKPFFKWLDEAVALSNDINMALGTYRDIMKMVKTAGHLRRMVPELYSLALGLNQNPSVRSSSVPHEWQKYPRRPVEWLTDTIAKCALLPESDAKWSKRDQYTWPIVCET